MSQANLARGLLRQGNSLACILSALAVQQSMMTMQQCMPQNMQQQQQQAPPPRDRLGDFQRTKPPTFTHSVEPLDADDWLRNVHKKLQVVQCNDREMDRRFCGLTAMAETRPQNLQMGFDVPLGASNCPALQSLSAKLAAASSR